MLPAEIAQAVKRIQFVTGRQVSDVMAGAYLSVFKGRGMEFDEVRPYVPGDDVRSIDWNVTARMGAPFIKQFVEERDLSVFLAVDVSGSLGVGSRAILKRELAAEVAALLSFAALRNQDRVGAALLSDRLELYLQPARRRAQVLRMVREILDRPAHGPTDLETSFAATLANLKRRSVLFLISDFVAAPCPRALKAAAVRHDLVVIEIVDPRDVDPPTTGPVVLTDAETGRVVLAGGARFARAQRERRAHERAELARLTAKIGADRLVLHTDRPYLPPLVAFFEARKKRLRR